MFRSFLLLGAFGFICASCHHAIVLWDSDSGTDSSGDSDSGGETDSDTDSDVDTGSDSSTEVCIDDADDIFCEDFESFDDGDLLFETFGEPWEVWPGGSDGQVSNEQSASGDMSLFVTDAGDIGLVLDLDAGRIRLDFKIFVNEGKLGFVYAWQIGTGWQLEFEQEGTAYFRLVEIGYNIIILEEYAFEFNYGEWIDVSVVFDFNAESGAITVGNGFSYSWPWDLSSIDGPFFYGDPDPPGAAFYVDDIVVTEL